MRQTRGEAVRAWKGCTANGFFFLSDETKFPHDGIEIGLDAQAADEKSHFSLSIPMTSVVPVSCPFPFVKEEGLCFKR
jgi:hypothetical protein